MNQNMTRRQILRNAVLLFLIPKIASIAGEIDEGARNRLVERDGWILRLSDLQRVDSDHA